MTSKVSPRSSSGSSQFPMTSSPRSTAARSSHGPSTSFLIVAAIDSSAVMALHRRRFGSVSIHVSDCRPVPASSTRPHGSVLLPSWLRASTLAIESNSTSPPGGFDFSTPCGGAVTDMARTCARSTHDTASTRVRAILRVGSRERASA